LADHSALSITDAVVDFLDAARSVSVGTCDATGRPHATRAAALRVADGRTHVTLYLAQAIAGATLRNVEQNARIAIQVSSPMDHRTLQLKGRVQATRTAGAYEEPLVRKFLEELATVLDQIGIPFERVMRLNHWPALAFEVHVDQVFLQTPGPGAGLPLAGRAP
jgi:hypothetical protein